MIELAKHIEVLLLENDCVIVPGLGGFIAHNRPAMWRTDSGEFFPPLRSIGFNPQLIMNDGVVIRILKFRHMASRRNAGYSAQIFFHDGKQRPQ